MIYPYWLRLVFKYDLEIDHTYDLNWLKRMNTCISVHNFSKHRTHSLYQLSIINILVFNFKWSKSWAYFIISFISQAEADEIVFGQTELYQKINY